MPSSRSELAVHITPVVPCDVSAILEIERESFAEQPWGRQELQTALRNATMMIARHEQRVVGYIVLHFARPRIEIWNLAVHPGQRRRGIGRRLVEHAKGRLNHFKLRTIRADVLAADRPTQDFLQRLDFRPGRQKVCCDPTIRYTFRRRDIGLEVLRSILEGEERVIRF